VQRARADSVSINVAGARPSGYVKWIGTRWASAVAGECECWRVESSSSGGRAQAVWPRSGDRPSVAGKIGLLGGGVSY